MVFIRSEATLPDGRIVPVRYEGPKDAQGRTPVGYLKPSGETYMNPMYAWSVKVGAPLDSIREAHKGIDGQGNEGVSDQRWIYDMEEAAALQRDEPDRFVRVES